MGARVWGRVRGLEIGLFGPWNCGGDSPIDSAEDRCGGGEGTGERARMGR